MALTALLGAVIFDETLNVSTIAGISLIIVGLVFVQTGSHQAQPPAGEDQS